MEEEKLLSLAVKTSSQTPLSHIRLWPLTLSSSPVTFWEAAVRDHVDGSLLPLWEPWIEFLTLGLFP